MIRTLLILAFAGTAVAVEKKPVGPSVSGTVKSADAKAGKLTIVLPAEKGANAEERTFDTANAVILLNDSAAKNAALPKGKLEDLVPRTSVNVQLGVDMKTVESITARGPVLQAGVKAVDAEKKTITLTLKGEKGATEKVVALAEGAKVLMGDGVKKGDADKEGTLKDVAAGATVSVQLSVDQKKAFAVRPQGANFRGTLKGIDTGNRNITVTIKGDGEVVDKLFTYDEGANVDTNAKIGGSVTVRTSVFDKDKAIQLQEVK